MLSKVKKLDMKLYDVKINLVDHIELYEGLKELNAANDEMEC